MGFVTISNRSIRELIADKAESAEGGTLVLGEVRPTVELVLVVDRVGLTGDR